jgi:hypothetical protein
MAVLPVYADHDKNGSSPRFDGDGTDRVPSLFSGFVHTVLGDQAARILKDQCRQLE